VKGFLKAKKFIFDTSYEDKSLVKCFYYSSSVEPFQEVEMKLATKARKKRDIDNNNNNNNNNKNNNNNNNNEITVNKIKKSTKSNIQPVKSKDEELDTKKRKDIKNFELNISTKEKKRRITLVEEFEEEEDQSTDLKISVTNSRSKRDRKPTPRYQD
jgi:hypothetical protein